MAILDGHGAVESLPKLRPVVSTAEVHDDDRGRALGVPRRRRSRPTSSTSPRPAAATRRSSSACRRGPRCSWRRAARAHAAARGRRYATPDDVKAMAVPCLSHRLLLRTDRGARLDPADAIGEILADVPVPIAR